MPQINNIPDDMITEHINWHTRPGNPSQGGRAINPWPFGAVDPAPGSGEEFLVWHKGYVGRFYDWVSSLPNNERPDGESIAAWTSIPMGLKMGMVGWNSNHARDEVQLNDMSNFATLDTLGTFLEFGMHSFLHTGSAAMWNEPIILTFASPRSTYFWQLHGLIDHWRQQWVDTQSQPQRPRIPEAFEAFEVLRRRGWPWPPLPPRVPPRPWPPFPGPGPDPAPPFDLTPEEIQLVGFLRTMRRQ